MCTWFLEEFNMLTLSLYNCSVCLYVGYWLMNSLLRFYHSVMMRCSVSLWRCTFGCNICPGSTRLRDLHRSKLCEVVFLIDFFITLLLVGHVVLLLWYSFNRRLQSASYLSITRSRFISDEPLTLSSMMVIVIFQRSRGRFMCMTRLVNSVEMCYISRRKS